MSLDGRQLPNVILQPPAGFAAFRSLMLSAAEINLELHRIYFRHDPPRARGFLPLCTAERERFAGSSPVALSDAVRRSGIQARKARSECSDRPGGPSAARGERGVSRGQLLGRAPRERASLRRALRPQGRGGGARFFGYFLAAQQESISPAGASPGKPFVNP